MIHFVYILYSPSRKLFYTGITNNLERRLKQYNAGESGFTANGIPWTLVWTIEKQDKSSAEKLERKLKNLSHGRKIKFIRKYREGIENQQLMMTLS